jgi:hypothetical protein
MTDWKPDYAKLSEVTLHYVTAGAGDPVALLHGWPQTWFMWRKIIPGLAERYRVIAPDLRGLGDSTRPAEGYDKASVAADLRELVHDHLGLDQILLVGTTGVGPWRSPMPRPPPIGSASWFWWTFRFPAMGPMSSSPDAGITRSTGFRAYRRRSRPSASVPTSSISIPPGVRPRCDRGRGNRRIRPRLQPARRHAGTVARAGI